MNVNTETLGSAHCSVRLVRSLKGEHLTGRMVRRASILMSPNGTGYRYGMDR